jgi:YggT family protein
MAALIFLINTLLSLCLLAVLLRLLLQWVRADFRNPLARALIQITSPVLVMLRVAVPWLLAGLGLPAWPLWLRLSASELLQTVLWTYFLAIVFYSLLSMLSQGQYNPAQALLGNLCEPLLRPVRRLIPPFGGLDLSTLWVCIAIQALLILLG